MTWPTLTISAAFGIDPLTVPSAGQWVDISAHVRSLDWTRGRNHELARTTAGQLTIRLRNTDRRFDPTHTTGPYYPNVRPMTRIRVRAVHAAVTYDLFTGYVEDWGQQWSPRAINAAGDAEASVLVVDAFKLFSLLPLHTYSATVLEDEPLGYWKLDEAAGAEVAKNLGSVGETADGVYQSLATPGDSSSPFAFGVPSSTLFGNSAISGFVEVPAVDEFTLRRDLTLECWLRPTSATGYMVVHGNDSIAPKDFSWGVTGSGFLFEADNLGLSVTFATDPALSAWHHYAMVRRGSVLELFVDGALVESKLFGPGFPNAVAGLLIGTELNGRMAHLAIYDRALSAERIAVHAAETYDAFPAQLSGAHLGEVLDALGWPAGERDIDAGMSTVQATTPSGSALEWMLAIAEDTEQGLLQMTGDGKVRFHDRGTLQDSAHLTPVASFGDSAAETVEYADLQARYDDADLYSEVTVPRANGVEARAADATAAADFGPRSLSRPTSLADSDLETTDIARWLLERYKVPALRFDRVTLDPFDATARWTQALARDIHADRLTVKRRPPGGGSAISVDALVEGLHHAVKLPRSWLVDFSLVPAHPLTSWLVGDTTYGVLGSTTRLGA